MQKNVTGSADGLSIGELSRRTGVAAPTLRSWEGRYGFPRSRRLAGGHRRYDEGVTDLIETVTRLRRGGMSLPAAIEAATAQAPQAEASVYAGLRRRHPGLVPQVMRKVTLLSLTRAIEDECCAQAARPALFAAFQAEQFYRQSRDRWDELARTARAVVIFAGSGGPAGPPAPPVPGTPALVPLAADTPMRREWDLVCDAPDHCACVTGWELPGQRDTGDADRRFEVIWSADPQVVRDAAVIGTGLALAARPDLGPLLAALPAGPRPPASADLRRATGLVTRMTAYLEQQPV